jgi:glycosyltransferase involved in cell wall biosynthesis
MNTPLVSCIVPVFNGERYLGEALDSILAQTYRQFECIVIDDGSTDGTAEVVSRYGERVSYLWQANAGPGAARNRGISAAEGDLVAFLDADDLWHPEKLARQVARFEARSELDLCITWAQNFCAPELSARDEYRGDPRYQQPWRGFGCPTLLARREAFDAIGGFNVDLRLGEDLDWFAHARERGLTLELLPDVLVYRRLHPWNTTRLFKARLSDALAEVVKRSLERRRAASRVDG